MSKKLKESETVELKKSTGELKEAIVSIVAILNKHQKGELYFGCKNDGTAIGQEISEQTLRDISKSISDNIEPKIYPQISRLAIDRKQCIRVSFSGENIPYFAHGRAYTRIADENKTLSAKELEKIIIEKNKEKLRWDTEICKESSIKDIDSKKLKLFLKESGKAFDNLSNSLNKLNLAKSGKPVNAAVILFGRNPVKFFPNARLRCAVFGGKNTAGTIDMQDFEGDLFHLIEQAEKYILKNIHIGMTLDGLKRIDVPEISRNAFREAIINAFCHRDYWKPDSVNVAIFTDRLEIRSPGLLYGGLTIEKIKTENVSERRNELLAKLFHDVHYVENWGRGISEILKLEPSADFKEVGTHFITVFKRKAETPQVGELGEKSGEKLGENERKILRYIATNPHITTKELSDKLNITDTAVYKNIKKLKEKGLLVRIGGDKGGYWKLK